MIDPLNKLCKWRMVLAGWHHGTRSMEQPGTKAMRDLMDKWLIMRVECSALTQILIAKGLCTEAEFRAQVMVEATALDLRLQEVFPGFETTEDGVAIKDIEVAQRTMHRLGFPP